MSKGQNGAEGKLVTRTYYNLKLEPKDWCGYHKGVCGIENNIGPEYCWACKYRRALDVPTLLAERGRR